MSPTAAAKSLQLCLTLCDPIEGSPPGSPIPGILQARTLEWVAMSFSNAWKWKVKVKSLSHVRLLATPWAAAYQAPPYMGFSRQEYWSGVPLPSPDVSHTAGIFFTIWATREVHYSYWSTIKNKCVCFKIQNCLFLRRLWDSLLIFLKIVNEEVFFLVVLRMDQNKTGM